MKHTGNSFFTALLNFNLFRGTRKIGVKTVRKQIAVEKGNKITFEQDIHLNKNKDD